MYFTSIYLHSGGSCGPEDVEAPFEQRGVSQASTSRAALSSLKTHFCQTCGPVLSDIVQLAEHQGTPHSQKVFRCGVCMKQFNCTANLQTHQKQHQGEKPLRSSVDRALFVKSYKFHVSEKSLPVTKSRWTSWPIQNIYSSRTLRPERSPTQSSRVGQQYKREKLVPTCEKIRNPLAPVTHTCSGPGHAHWSTVSFVP